MHRLAKRVAWGIAGITAAAVLFAMPLQASVVQVAITGSDGTSTWVDNLSVPINADGSFEILGATSTKAGWTAEDINLAGNADPFVNFGFTITNSLNVEGDYNIVITVPVTDNWAASCIGGSIGFTLVDRNLDGTATLSTDSPLPIYQSRLDGVDQQSLFDDPYALSVAIAGGSTIDSDSFGLPGFTVPGGPLTATMQVELNFRLSARDRVVISGTFVAVPEPGTLAIVGLGMLGIGLMVRRQRVEKEIADLATSC